MLLFSGIPKIVAAPETLLDVAQGNTLMGGGRHWEKGSKGVGLKLYLYGKHIVFN